MTPKDAVDWGLETHMVTPARKVVPMKRTMNTVKFDSVGDGPVEEFMWRQPWGSFRLPAWCRLKPKPHKPRL